MGRKSIVLIHDHGDGLGTSAMGLRRRGFSRRLWHPVFEEEPPLPLAATDLIAEPFESADRFDIVNDLDRFAASSQAASTEIFDRWLQRATA